MILVTMGVAGSGKTTVGQQLATVLGWQFLEGDDFHPAANVSKMSRGEPLTDDDRWPWLAALRHEIEQILIEQESAVIACSALKQQYRAILQGQDKESVRFIYLDGHPENLRSRLLQRQNHFMKANMLSSQLATLEAPEDAIVINIDEHTDLSGVIATICCELGHTG